MDPILIDSFLAATAQADATRYREIPYNYTSFSDREIVIKLLGERAWQILSELGKHRETGRSARMLYEVLGKIWVVQRNPYLQDEMIADPNRRAGLRAALRERMQNVIGKTVRDDMTGNVNKQLEAIESRRIAQMEFSAPMSPQMQQRINYVSELLALAYKATERFEQQLDEMQSLRRSALRELQKYTDKKNICFDGFARVSHVTDATDWRVEYPFVVIYPRTEQEISGIVLACKKLGLTVIARGGGTGYTGGAVPLYWKSAVINTEKLTKISTIEWITPSGLTQSVATVETEAGVVTQTVADLAEKNDLVFAVDPTSAQASCIGGNIAVNAGGKKAVLWGTAIDNLVSWRMVNAQGHWVHVTRLQHNLGKIHHVKIASFQVQVLHKNKEIDKYIVHVEAERFRATALGKDVTDKFLAGLPGIQKEGCDGIITSARWLLHRLPKYGRTVTLEFFGSVHEAVPSIVEIKALMDSVPEGVLLAGLEHLDERYLKAVDYSPKTSREQHPKMILLGDIVGDDEQAVARVAAKIIRIANSRHGEGFIAVSEQARQVFWQPRNRTAAIARHTNAFKINEDVVIPLAQLGEYVDGIERINIEYSLKNKLKFLASLEQLFEHKLSTTLPDEQVLEQKSSTHADWQQRLQSAKALLVQVQQRWLSLSQALDLPLRQWQKTMGIALDVDDSTTVFEALQKRQLSVSWKQELKVHLQHLFSGAAYAEFFNDIEKLHRKILSSRTWVALHMHAGDGNVHTNIPVNSADYDMLQDAKKAVNRIMELATQLGGVVSGEHGIGITKLEYLDQETLDEFAVYKQKTDPDGVFNRGKLLQGSDLRFAYTPSFSLLGAESLIMQKTDLNSISDSIKDCLRCGKCKPVCPTHVPTAQLLYSPRNKILATSLLIEAILYNEQTSGGVSSKHWYELDDVADHCTLCHKCLAPCPVNIDFGDVSMNLRFMLTKLGCKQKNMVSNVTMLFLNSTRTNLIQSMRTVLRMGFALQRLAYRLARILRISQRQVRQPPPSTGHAPIVEQVIHFINKPMPAGLPKKTARALLNIVDKQYVPVIRDPKTTDVHSEAVFYFPGCGSERLYSQIGIATLAMLWHAKVQTVLPPGYLCCGYPQRGVGANDKAQAMITDNRVLLHRVANSLNYLQIKTVVVSCGTCYDQLLGYQFDKIFPGCRIVDIHEYLNEKGLRLTHPDSKDAPSLAKRYLYHDPCHSPMRLQSPLRTVRELIDTDVILSERCCGEAGTLALSRPDISTQVRSQKEAAIRTSEQALRADGFQGQIKILTSCPACLQGLSRYRDDLQTGLLEADYIVVEMAKQLLGEHWLNNYVALANTQGIERVLL